MDKLTGLWYGAAYQDQLLQSYRRFNLQIQSVLLALGTGLTVATLTIENSQKSFTVYLILIVFTLLAICLLRSMQRLISARSTDVDYYHKRIIEVESILPKEDQILTAFKVYQKFHRNQSTFPSYFETFYLTPEIRGQLVGARKGHTRKVLDVYLFWGCYGVWGFLHLTCLFSLYAPFT